MSSTYLDVVQTANGARALVHQANGPVDDGPVNGAVVDHSEIVHIGTIGHLPAHEVIGAVVHGIDGGKVGGGACRIHTSCCFPHRAGACRNGVTGKYARRLVGFDARVTDDRAPVFIKGAVELISTLIKSAGCPHKLDHRVDAPVDIIVHVEHDARASRAIDAPQQEIQHFKEGGAGFRGDARKRDVSCRAAAVDLVFGTHAELVSGRRVIDARAQTHGRVHITGDVVILEKLEVEVVGQPFEDHFRL